MSTAGRVGFWLDVFFLLIELAIGVIVRSRASIAEFSGWAPFAKGQLHHTAMQSERDVLPQLSPAVSQNMTAVRLDGRILDVSKTFCQVLG